MAKPLVSDELWKQIEPLLPAPKPRRSRNPGRRPMDPRKVLTGILFVLKSGIPWEELPVEMGCGCGMTCLNYLKYWREAGVWPRLHDVLRKHFADDEKLDWSRVTGDTLTQPPRESRPAAARPSHNGDRWQDRRTYAAAAAARDVDWAATAM
jgi:transposase